MPTTVADLGDTIDLIHQKAIHARQFAAVMSGLSWTIRQGKGSSVNVPYFNEGVARTLTEGVDNIIEETMQDTNVAVTYYEAGLKVILTNNVIEDNNEDLIAAAGVFLGNAYEKKLDNDLLTLLASGGTTLGGASTTLTMGHIAAGRATLMGNPTSAGGPAPTPYVCVIHPFSELDLVDVLTPIVPVVLAASIGYGATPGSITDEIIRNYSIGRLFGMPIIDDGNFSFTGTTDVKQGVFSAGTPGGIIYAPRRQPVIEPEKDASLRGIELNYYGRYGVSVFRSGWVVTLYNDASTPS